MVVLTVIKSAVSRSFRIWKAAVIVWFVSLLLVGAMALPVRAAINADFRRSMITEKLLQGFNLEIFTDFGHSLNSILSFLSTSFLLTLLTGFLLNAFFTGGLFKYMQSTAEKFHAGVFFSASARNFWSFILIGTVINIFLIVLGVVIIIIPVLIAAHVKEPGEATFVNTIIISVSLFFLVSPFFVLVADYARAWQVSQERAGSFRAIGFGFRQIFKTFRSSYLLILGILFLQLLFQGFVLLILSRMTPTSGFGVFLFLLLSQLLFIISIMIKVWRYGSVTALMEKTTA